MLDRLDALPDPQRDAARTAFGLTTGTAPDRLLIGLALLNLLADVAGDRPLLCVIDDAHWLDRASARTLAFVTRRLPADRVAMVFATRGPVADFEAMPELVVDGLHDGDAQTLLSAVLHVPIDTRVRDRIVAETRGNPLAIVEWPRGLTPAELAGGFGMPVVMPMTGQIEESFRRRLTELPEPAQRFLTIAAAEPTGDPVIVWRAAESLGIAAPDVAPAIEAGLVEIGVRVQFRHPLVRTAAYRTAAIEDRQAAHRELARATDPAVDPDRRAWHRALGSPGPDEEIAAALEHSAHRARSRGGLSAAAALLERSAALTLNPTARANRILSAASEHLEAGSFTTAARLLASAETAPLDDLARAHLDLLRARHATFGGDPRDVVELILRAATRLEDLDPAQAASTYLQALSSVCLVGSMGRGVGIADVAKAASTCPPSPFGALNDLVAGLSQVTLEGPVAAGPALRRALDATPADTPHGSYASQAIHWLGYRIALAAVLWDANGFRSASDAHVTIARRIGSLAMLPSALNSVAQARLFEGDLDGAACAVDEANRIYEATGSHLLASVGALHAGLQGRDDALQLIDRQLESARTAGFGLPMKSALWATATFYNGRGQYERALDAANEAMSHPWEWSGHIFFSELIEAASRSGDRDTAAGALRRLTETVDPNGSDWAIGVLRRCEALLAAGSVAERKYRDAIERLSRTTVRPELARAHLHYGEWLRRENRRVDARAQLRAAHELFAAMGILGFAERARHELLATGETVRKRTNDSFDELTPQEAHIARLAADGLTNPEIGAQLFISPRTVEWHLRKVFTKLSITSRRELRDAVPRPRV
jgi:tetratricopeptide (TPR) repeat protein